MSTIDQLPLGTLEHTMFSPGDVQGNYVLEGLVTQREYSEVYKGFNPATGQLVAVKFARDYQPGGSNPIALEASVHKKVNGQDGILPVDGADIFGVNGAAPHIATEFQENGTYAQFLKQEVGDENESPRSAVLKEMRKELQALIESHEDEPVDIEILTVVNETLGQQNVPDALAHAAIDPTPEGIVQTVVDVAEREFGGNCIDPNGLTAQMLALKAVETAETVEKSTVHQSVETEKPAPTREEIELRLRILKGVAVGYVALHDAGYIDRDGKPDNYYVTSNIEGLLGDFSAAVKNGYVAEHIDIGSPGYMAPEEGAAIYADLVNVENDEDVRPDALREVKGIRYTAAGDMYRFFSVVMESVTGIRPYPVSTVRQKRTMLNPYVHEPRGLELLSKAPIEPDLRRMILRGMSNQMSDRPVAPQAAELLSRY